MKFCSFASGSSGNCYLIKSKKTAVLIDAGISGKRIFECLEKTGTETEDVSALLVTHEHSDHVQSLPVVSKKIKGIKVFANKRTWEAITRPVAEDKRETFETGENFTIGDLTIHPFPVSHDAREPVGFTITSAEKQISILTDSGEVTEKMLREIANADLLVIEANHEKEMLLMGTYPYELKQRILGSKGHLSNVNTGEILSRIIMQNPKKRRILLGHLSRENNEPAVALLAVKNTLEENGIHLGRDIKLEICARETMGKIYSV